MTNKIPMIHVNKRREICSLPCDCEVPKEGACPRCGDRKYVATKLKGMVRLAILECPVCTGYDGNI